MFIFDLLICFLDADHWLHRLHHAKIWNILKLIDVPSHWIILLMYFYNEAIVRPEFVNASVVNGEKNETRMHIVPIPI